jgi:hypothetical protein
LESISAVELRCVGHTRIPQVAQQLKVGCRFRPIKESLSLSALSITELTTIRTPHVHVA